MRKSSFLLTIMCSALNIANAADTRLDYQKALSQIGDKTGKPLNGIRSEGKDLLATARGEANGISQQDYNFLKGTSAFAASGAEWAHLDGITGEGVTILLLENSGINHADTRGIVEAGSPQAAIAGKQYKLDHGSGMASLIHSIAPASSIRVRPVREWSSSLGSVRIINASFGNDKANGFANSFPALTAANNVLITKAAGNNQENLSAHQHTQGCESLLPFTIFTGNLRQDYKGKTSSGFPGANPAFQNSFLWVIADDVLAASGADGSTEYSPGSGTSNAAAILSGAAALILSKYPGLTTEQLKEILLESADRDIFQLFGSGYRALHISDNSVDFYRKHTQYKKTHKDKSILDFAENLATSDDIILAAEIVGGSRGVSNRGTTPAEVEQFKRILKKIKESGNDTLESLSPATARTEPERMHRERIQQLLAEITTDASSASPAVKEKSPTYDPAFWGKGILNIKNALLYAQFKMRYPAMSAHELRERMLRFINTQQQVAAERIQRKLRSRPKATEEQKAAWDQRQGLAINTSLPDRTFTKMPTDPSDPGVPDQSDEDRLKGLGVELPEEPTRKQLKVISDDSSGGATSSVPAREIAPIADSDIPVGASAELREFLKADSENLIKTFNAFSDQMFKPLMDLAPEQIANSLLALNLHMPFSANRVIYKDGYSFSYSCSFYNERVTIITLFHDFLRLQIALGQLTEDKAKITKTAMHLLNGYATALEKQEILSLLKQYIEYGDTEVHNFIINNDLLNMHFRNVEIETDYSSQLREKRIKFEPHTGFDMIGEYELSKIMDNSPSPQTKVILKRFFKTETGRSVLARIAIKEPIQQAIEGLADISSYRWNTPNLADDITAEGQRILPTIFSDAGKKLPKLFSILPNYADRGDIPALITAMSQGYNQIQIEGSSPGLTALVNGYLAATLPSVFE
jgi:hypothetical protein